MLPQLPTLSKLAMQGVPDVQTPHRFTEADGFPHAVQRSRSGETKYFLDTSRRARLTFRFGDHLPPDLNQYGIGIQVRLLLEIEVGEDSWREAKPGDFSHGMRQSASPSLNTVIRAQEKVTHVFLAIDGSVTFDAIVLNVLSTHTSPRNRRLRFKV